MASTATHLFDDDLRERAWGPNHRSKRSAVIRSTGIYTGIYVVNPQLDCSQHTCSIMICETTDLKGQLRYVAGGDLYQDTCVASTAHLLDHDLRERLGTEPLI